MKKLQLDIDALSIESFATGSPDAERGTVAANAITTGANTCYHCTRFGCPPTGLCM
jgi:tetrahydromethanopterin S-methyltransferase subunit E